MANAAPSNKKRILKEINDMKESKLEGISAQPRSENDLEIWDAVIIGPKLTPYEDGEFHLTIKIPALYPFSPPKVVFETNIFHCNIHNNKICLDILGAKWSPALTIEKVLLSISSLLSEPNPNDPLDPVAGRLYSLNRKEYERIAREKTLKYAVSRK